MKFSRSYFSKFILLIAFLCGQIAIAPVEAIAQQTSTATSHETTEVQPFAPHAEENLGTDQAFEPVDNTVTDPSRGLPIVPVTINGVTVAMSSFSYRLSMGVDSNLSYRETDILTTSKVQTEAVLNFISRINETEPTIIVNYVANDLSGRRRNEQFLQIVPHDLKSQIHEADISPTLMSRLKDYARKAASYVQTRFNNARSRFVRSNYQRFANLGESGRYRVWFSLGRLVWNGTAAATSISIHGPMALGNLAYGLEVGGMSGSLNYFNQIYFNVIDKYHSEALSQGVFAGIEQIFIILQALGVSAITGMAFAHSPLGYVSKDAMYLGLGLFAQYPWDKANAMLDKLFKQIARNKSDMNFFRSYGAMKTMVVSMAQVPAVSLLFTHPLIGVPALLATGASGFYFKRIVGRTTVESLKKKFSCIGILDSSEDSAKSAPKTETLQWAPGIELQSVSYGNGANLASFRFVYSQ